jgi:hypothetical protein
MFRDCTNILSSPRLPGTIMAEGCYGGIFHSCINILSLHFATINDAVNPFMYTDRCTSLTIDDTTPPDISVNTLSGLNQYCNIYVPAQSVTDYQTAPIWSDRYAYIQAIPTP